MHYAMLLSFADILIVQCLRYKLATIFAEIQ